MKGYKKMKNIILLVVSAVVVLGLALFGIDREVARQDYVENGVAEHCIFDINCNF